MRLYNTETDEMAREVETRMGPIYNIVLSDKLLVCLSGWSLQIWRIDSSSPARVIRPSCHEGVLPDFLPSSEFSNWLEVHCAVINPRWLVTRATRQNQNTTTCVSFLHVRRCGPDGWVGPVLRPDQAALSADVVEVGGMELSCLDRLALLKMVRAGDDLRYVITVMDVLTGVELASLPSYGASILGCVQVNTKQESFLSG